VVFFYAYEGYTLGFLLASLDLGSFILSFIIALKCYPFVAKILVTAFGIPIGFANAIAFFLIAFISELILGFLSRRFLHLLPKIPAEHIMNKIIKGIDHWLGFLPGMLSAFIILSFLLSVIVSLPSSPLIKQLATNSVIGSKLLENTSFFEAKLNDIFGGALHETLNFITVKPDSDETVPLHFTTEQEPLMSRQRAKCSNLLTSNGKKLDSHLSFLTRHFVRLLVHIREICLCEDIFLIIHQKGNRRLIVWMRQGSSIPMQERIWPWRQVRLLRCRDS
jgi:uncharacterized membrane protein required for colicin V production